MAQPGLTTWRERLLVLLLLLAVLPFGGSQVAQSLDRYITDVHWRIRAARDPRPFPLEIVIIAIDDATLQDPAFGQTRGFSRRRHAELLTRLRLARAVGFDIIFAEPDGGDPGGDAALAAAIRDHGRTVLGCFLFAGVRELDTRRQEDVRRLVRRLPRPAAGGLRWPLGLRAYDHHLVPPLPALAEAAAAIGNFDVEADPDGVYRRPAMALATDSGALLPHFAVAVAAVASGLATTDVLAGAPSELRLGAGPVPLVDGRLWLRPLARRATLGSGLGKPVTTISYRDAVSADPEQFRDRTVLIGETATGTTDKRPNPLDQGLCGVELIAEIIANLRYDLPAERLPLAVELALVVLAVVPPIWLFLFLPPGRATGQVIILAVLLVAGLEAAFWIGRYVPDWSRVLLGLVGSTLVMGLQRLVTEELRKLELRRSFSMYVAPEIVDQIAENPAIARQQGVRQPLCVLFSDIRSFTAYCEKTPPEQVVAQISEYLTSMTEAVERYRGVLDKFIGDAVMALFGPFLEADENASALACACALEMLERLERLNGEWSARGWGTIAIGIGVHYGDAIVGNIGSTRRMQYTALGDTVNAASRLEGLTKELGAELLATEEVREQAAGTLGERVRFERLGEFAVRNRTRPLVVYRVDRGVRRGAFDT